MAPGLNFLEHTHYTIYLHRYTVYTCTLYIYTALVGLKEYIVIYYRTLP